MTDLYGSASYWEERYRKSTREPFEWYQKFAALKPHIDPFVASEDCKILVVGCGISPLSEELYDTGKTSLTNIDISKTAIEIMVERNKERKVMDVKKMEFEDGTFDFVFGKALLDSQMCGENSTANAHSMMSEIVRVLKPSGVYMEVSYGVPENRLSYIEKEEYGWGVDTQKIEKPQIPNVVRDEPEYHYIYISKKSG